MKSNGAFSTTTESIATILDGSSQTAAGSEQILGKGPGTDQATATPAADVRFGIARTSGTVLDPTDPTCGGAGGGWRFDRGNGWWDGDYRSGLYNHFLAPNSRSPDCLTHFVPHDPAFKAARSLHPGGANVLFCDGHVAFAKESVSQATWRAISTRAGNEIVSGGDL